MNVLFIMIDDLRWPEIVDGTLSSVGDTPGFDALFSDSLVFRNAHVQATICTASRSSILTGRRRDTLKYYSFVRQGGCTNCLTIPELFRAEGYRTVGSGKIFHSGHNKGGAWDDYPENVRTGIEYLQLRDRSWVSRNLEHETSALSCTDLGWANASTWGSTNVCGGSGVGGKCSSDVSWPVARDYCEEIGARLCSAVELENNEARDTGCELNSAMVWSSDKCGDSSYSVARGATYGIGESATICASENSNVAVRCCADVETEIYNHDEYTLASTREFILEAASNGAQPYFIAAGFKKPHLPFVAPSRFFEKTLPVELPPSFNSCPPHMLHGERGRSNEVGQYADLRATGLDKQNCSTEYQSSLDKNKASELLRGYSACVLYIDFMVGILVDDLKASGLWNRTIIMALSDHGFKLGTSHVAKSQSTLTPVFFPL